MKKTLTVILIMAVTLFAAAFGLDSIARENAQKEHIWLMETLLPGGRDFKRVPYSQDDIIKSVHQADAGFVIETATHGYASRIVMLIGVNNSGEVTGLVVCDAHETLGLGSKILTDHAFLAQFLDQNGSFAIGTPGADAFSGATDPTPDTGEQIYVDGISGATVSSKAVARCVNAAIAYVTGADIGSSATSWGG